MKENSKPANLKYLFKLALANIFRRKRRTILTMSVIAFCMLMYVSFTGLIKGLQDKQKENLIGFETAHFKIRNTSFDENNPYFISNFITNYNQIESVLQTKKYVRAFTERTSFIADLDNGIDTLSVLATGVDLQKDPEVFSLTNYIIDGKMESGGIVLGKSLADDMKIDPGDVVYLTFKNGQGAIDSIGFIVSGVIQAADSQVNNSSVFITLEDAEKALNSGSVMEIAVKIFSPEETQKFQTDLENSLPGYKVYNWKKLGEYFLKFAQTDAAGAYVTVFLFAIIALVGIVNTMMLSVFEKRKEIGMLKALGMTDREVETLFIIEGFWIGFWGSVIGIVIGALINFYLVQVGIDMTVSTSNSQANIGYKIMGIVKSKWDITGILTGLVAGVLFSSLASYYPAKKTAKLQPVDCLRNL